MYQSTNYYSSSLLSAYLSDPDSGHPNNLPQIKIEDAGYVEKGKFFQDNLENQGWALSASSRGPESSRISVISAATSVGTSRSSVSALSDDSDLQSIRLPIEQLVTSNPRLNAFKKLKQRIMHEEKQPEGPQGPQGEDEQFFAYVNNKLKTTFYSYGKNETLDINWANAAEVFFFGDTLSNLFTDSQHLLNYTIHSGFEVGEVRFSNRKRYHSNETHDESVLLKQLIPRLENLNGVLDLYAESKANFERPELFETFAEHANHDEGLCIPLAISMFGNWLLSYKKDSTNTSNYQDSQVLNYFRKAARFSLVIRKLRGLFEKNAESLGRSAYLELKRYWDKDNNNALATSLHSLGEYYQYLQNHDVAVTLWELNCHLTEDVESGNLAILGLKDGYGFGNHSKEHNAFGKKSRAHKFNTKRRIAHIYRVLMKDPDFNEFGVSWASKDKYD